MLRSKQRVVLVEDHPGDAFLAWERLTEVQPGRLQVDVVPSLAQTLALLAEGPVDAIVLNLSLPDSHGLATLHRVREAAAGAAIIVVTDHVDASLREQVLAAGAEDVYDKADSHGALFSRSVLYVVERNRARLQQERLQVLLETLPYAVVIVDDRTLVRFANPAALALFGCSDAAPLAELIDFSSADGPAASLTVQHGVFSHRCEVQVVSIEWEGQSARLASVLPLPSGLRVGPAAGAAPQAAAPDQRLEEATRIKGEFLASMSLQISQQMHTVSGLSDVSDLSHAWQQRTLQPTQSPLQCCYGHPPRTHQPSLLAALQMSASAAAAGRASALP